jgi:hypothetical protein
MKSAHPECVAALRDMVDKTLQPGRPPMDCPICERLVFLVRRKLHTGMALSLIAFYKDWKYGDGSPCDYRVHLHRGASRDHGYLRFWGLAEAVTAHEGKDLPKGFYQITPRGVRFIEEEITVPKWVWTYNDKVYVKSEERTDIRTALGDKFDLTELLRDNTLK